MPHASTPLAIDPLLQPDLADTPTNEVALPEDDDAPAPTPGHGLRPSCAYCRRRKIRCDGNHSGCLACLQRKQACIFEPMKVMGRPRKTQGVARVPKYTRQDPVDALDRYKNTKGKSEEREGSDERLEGSSSQAGYIDAESYRRFRSEGAARQGRLLLHFGAALRSQLVVDWMTVSQQQMVVPLPRRPSVKDILAYYQAHLSSTPADAECERPSDMTSEICHGLLGYFDQLLPTLLLYEAEIPQYQFFDQLYGTSLTPSSLYGAEHLLRLFVKLPEIVTSSEMDPNYIATLQSALGDMLVWMDQKKEDLFIGPERYIPSAPNFELPPGEPLVQPLTLP